MNKEEKKQIVEELTAKLSKTDYFYITDGAGMSVEQTNNFRRACFNSGLEYKVFKNSLIKKALGNIGGDFTAFQTEKVLKGFSGIIFSTESANKPAKVLLEFRKKSNQKENPKPSLKGASLSFDLFIGDKQLEVLSTLKSKDELVGEVIGLLQSPARNVISALQSGGGILAGLVKTLSEREEK